ncbi:hypothetical protein [Rhizomonospora bruguierae]|uniref:hypothetical protein n=1 Tax=Rhizomonospora bruguierae TaxID=1581705 RepID=UPI001BCF1FD1|nr:hypothetical protein [Micromonospora sp. NBRC 107566]
MSQGGSPGWGEGPGDPAGEGGPVRTGHPAVDGALQAMANAAELPAAEQIAEYEAAHRTLQETLATIDEA